MHDIIQGKDNIVLHREMAWHGLGIVVEDAPTPREALTIAGLDWGVIQRPMFVQINGKQQMIEGWKGNFRADTGDQLGIVSEGYQAVSNADMADFCEALVDEGKTVRCESAGSIQAGKKVWFLLKGEEFQVGHGDGIFPYICVSNGHDGGTGFRVTPTTTRVVCRNTLMMVIPNEEKFELATSAICIRHTQNIMKRIEDAKFALKNYANALEQTKKFADTLYKTDVNSDQLKQFFAECYEQQIGNIPTNPKDGFEQRRYDKAQSAWHSFSKRFDDETNIAGTSFWNAANAWSGLIQHDMKARGKTDVERVEKRVESNLFGLAQDRTVDAFRLAFRMLAS